MKRKYTYHERQTIKQFKRTHFAKCYYCSKIILNEQDITYDHYYPVSKGGKTTKKNGRISCYKCNREKADMNPNWYFRLKRRANTKKMKEFTGKKKKIGRLISGGATKDNQFIARKDSRILDIKVLQNKWNSLPYDRMRDLFSQI